MERINWKIAADRLTIGERVELKTLPGYWVRPRRFSKAGEAEILAAQARAMATSRVLTAEVVEEYTKNAPSKSDAEAMTGAISPQIKAEIGLKVAQNATAEMVGHVDEDVRRILYGIEDHNFEDEAGSKPSAEWAREVMERADVANEILAIIREKNLPLARQTPPSSATSPNGSTTAPDLEPTPESTD